MVIRAQVGTVKPNPRFHGHTSHISPISKYPFVALSYPNWRDAMYDKYNALIKNSTWVLVSKPPNVNVVRSMWLFQHKYHADGSLSRYKARLVANGRSQQFGVDCDDTFSHVVKPATIRTKYAFELLDRAHMANCNPTQASVDTESKLGSDGDPISDPTLYRSFAGGLQYLTFTHPDISYAVHQVCLHMHDLREPHLTALKRDLRYVNNLRLWSAKRQHTLFRSSAEVENKGVANVVFETAWLCNLLRELHTLLLFATLVYCDNVSAIYMTVNPDQHHRTKHIKIDIHFVHDMVARSQVCVLHVPSRYQYADIFTKGLPSAFFEEFRTSLSVWLSPAQTVKAY
ncbi:ribonuclease H-like domain-containing protein [Tanacetum coccineum]